MRRILWIFLILLTSLTASLQAAGDSPGKGTWQDILWSHDFTRRMEQAGSSSRPVLIYFQAPWCSWCHVYERDTLSDPEVIRLVRNHFIPLLINSDARPDLLEKYNGFGLPFTVILSPKGQLLKRMPGILTAEDMVHTLQEVIRTQTGRQTGIEPRTIESIARVTTLDETGYRTFLVQWLDHMDDLYDPSTGLFSGVLESGAGLKRSAPQTWSWLLESGLWPQRTRRAVDVTRQNLYDSKRGGFYYFRDPHRNDQHLETAKLLDANAWLIYWFALAAEHYNDKALKAVAVNSFEYLQKNLWDKLDKKSGGFFQAQMADADYYNGKSTTAPELDRIKRTDSNAQAAFALLKTGRLMQHPAMIKSAIGTINYLLENHLRNGRLYHSRRDEGFGAAYNLPEDIFWLLAAIQEVQGIDKKALPADRVNLITRLAVEWLGKTLLSKSTVRHSSKLRGIIAYVAVNSSDQFFTEKVFDWALSGVHIEATTRPDELIFAIRAWDKHLKSTQ